MVDVNFGDEVSRLTFRSRVSAADLVALVVVDLGGLRRSIITAIAHVTAAERSDLESLP